MCNVWSSIRQDTLFCTTLYRNFFIDPRKSKYIASAATQLKACLRILKYVYKGKSGGMSLSPKSSIERIFYAQMYAAPIIWRKVG
jgi:hypothetical protein